MVGWQGGAKVWALLQTRSPTVADRAGSAWSTLACYSALNRRSACASSGDAYTLPEAKEGVAAFREKRKPQFPTHSPL
jgi:1,4-dihydroxy-2-naphthoyl-CoA synthase